MSRELRSSSCELGIIAHASNSVKQASQAVKPDAPLARPVSLSYSRDIRAASLVKRFRVYPISERLNKFDSESTHNIVGMLMYICAHVHEVHLFTSFELYIHG